MGKFPEYWIDDIAALLDESTDTDLLLTAIHSSTNSKSSTLAVKLLPLLKHSNNAIIAATIDALAGINLTDDLTQTLQDFSLHEDPDVQIAAKQAIDMVSRKNFERYMQNDLGMDPK